MQLSDNIHITLKQSHCIEIALRLAGVNYDTAPTFFPLKSNNTAKCFWSVDVLTRPCFPLFVCWPVSSRIVQANFSEHLTASVCRWLSAEYRINLQMEGLVFSFDGVNNYRALAKYAGKEHRSRFKTAGVWQVVR